MTTIQIPEPVAYRSKDQPYLFSLSPAAETNWDGLITTAQAEAYADARVRELLEADFDKSFALLSAWMRSTQSVANMGQMTTLCSLVEFALTNQSKTNSQLDAEYKLPGPASHNQP